MISFLKGRFVKKTPSSVTVDVGGVGYEVQISLNTYSAIQELEEGTIITHLIVREDAHILFGFSEADEKELFLHLLSVSGIGANTARVVLSYLKADELSKIIVQGDARALERIKGIGKKTAERIIVELKDKLSRHPIDSASNNYGQKYNSLPADALNALVALGINRQAAEAAVQKVLQQNPDASVELIVKKALQQL